MEERGDIRDASLITGSEVSLEKGTHHPVLLPGEMPHEEEPGGL